MQSHRWSDVSPLVWRLFAFTLIVGVATGLPEIIFNFYLASLGFDNAIAGQMVSLTRISGFLFGIPLGLAVDRFGGIRTIQIVGLANIVTWIVLLNTTDINVIRASYFFAGIFFTAQATAMLPMLSRVATPAQRPVLFGVNFGLIMTTGIISALIGGTLPGIIAEFQQISPTSYDAYRQALFSSVVLTVLALLSLVGMHKRIQQTSNQSTYTSTHESTLTNNPPLIARRTIALRSMGRITLGIGGGMLHPFLNLYLRQSYDLSDATIGIVIAIFSLASVIAGFISGSLTNRFGAQRTVVFSALFAGLIMLGALIPHPFVFIGIYTLNMFLIGQVYPSGDVLILNTVGTQQRGFTTSINNMFWSLGWAIAASLSGWLQIQSGFIWPIVIHVICMVFTAGIFWFNRYPPYEEAHARSA